MKVYQILIRKKADLQISEAFNWYENQRPGLGSEFLLSTEATLNFIQKNPDLFSSKLKNVRCALLPRFPYGIFYFIDSDLIVIIAVFHLSRNPKSWKSF